MYLFYKRAWNSSEKTQIKFEVFTTLLVNNSLCNLAIWFEWEILILYTFHNSYFCFFFFFFLWPYPNLGVNILLFFIITSYNYQFLGQTTCGMSWKLIKERHMIKHTLISIGNIIVTPNCKARSSIIIQDSHPFKSVN